MTHSRVDLHLHSRFSNRPQEWILRKAGMSKSYSDPRALYDQLRSRGFDYFTLTDHHTIEGTLSLEGLPGVFHSVQVTALFPEDRAAVELLIWGIEEPQLGRILELRENIYELQRYLLSERLVHAVAHPFFTPEDRLQTQHIEKLVLLFNHFEALNGMRAPLFYDFSAAFFGSLTEEILEQLATRHDMSSPYASPWRKVLVAGSDDQSGLSAGRAWTQCPPAGSVGELLEHLRQGRCEMAGKPGGPLTVAHGMYNKFRHVLGERFEPVRKSVLVQHALSRFMEGEDPSALGWREKWQIAVDGVLSGKVFELLKPANASMWKVLAGSLEGEEMQGLLRKRLEGVEEPERRAFLIANSLAGGVSFRIVSSFIKQISGGNMMQAIQDLAALMPILLPLAPYFFELRREAPDRRWLRTVSRGVHAQDLPPLNRRKVAWLTDTLEDVNGVSTTICKLASAGISIGCDVTVLTCRSDSRLTGVPLRNFQPVGEFALPEYELQKVAFPPVLEMLEYISQQGFTEVVISTPGPVGLVGLLAACLFGLPVSGIYHTDFPRYVRILTEDSSLESLAWTFMHWFYTGMDEIFVNSEPYREAWIARGAPASKLRILPRGLDTQLFHPSKRDAGFWSRFGVPAGSPVLLYVGRVSLEKGLDLLPQIMAGLKGSGAVMAVVGDGPYRAELQSLMPEAVFTGYLMGEDLARAYASSDVFVFPSTTDTYGNVVMEALASGVPCVVSDEGGPSGLVVHGETGFVTRSRDVSEFTAAVARLVGRSDLRKTMSANALSQTLLQDWTAAARRFFSPNPE